MGEEEEERGTAAIHTDGLLLVWSLDIAYYRDGVPLGGGGDTLKLRYQLQLLESLSQPCSSGSTNSVYMNAVSCVCEFITSSHVFLTANLSNGSRVLLQA